MGKILLAALLCLSSVSTNWLNNLEDAKAIAKKENKLIILNFSGSDWCGPCIRMHKEIFDSEAFQEFAADKLVMVNADFPRLKKNQLPKDQQSINDQLADRYNHEGKFPYTVLLNADGKVLKDWEGYPRNGMEAFMQDLKMAMNAGN
jgi:thioredoxin-related protein